MKIITGICVFAAVLLSHSTVLQASIEVGTSSNANSSRLERCSATLNKYLTLRHSNSSNLELISELEDYAAVVCKGYQVQLENKDGQLIGVIR